MNLIVNVIFTIVSLQSLSFCDCDNSTESSQSDESIEPDEYFKDLRFPRQQKIWGNQSLVNNINPANKELTKLFRSRRRRIRKQILKTRKRFQRIPFPHDLKRDRNDCFFKMPKEAPPGYYTPIPYRTDLGYPRILYPDIHGVISLKKNVFFKFSCPGTHFLPPIEPVEEITVKCLKHLYIKYNSKLFSFQNFSCETIPRPTVVQLNRTCQGANRVLEVGFKTQEHFFKMYRICFDPELLTPIYSWYVRKKPVYRHRQVAWRNPLFNNSELDHYKDVDVEQLYKTYFLKQSVSKAVRSVNLSDFYISFANKRMLKPYDLTSFYDFIYVFEQDAAFTTENSVPLWMHFTYYVWKDVERSFRYDMAVGQSRQAVITGTYDVTTLHDLNYVARPLYFAPPGRMPVPKFVWKLDYNLDDGTGIVYVGLNNPYSLFNMTTVMCDPVPCRESLILRRKFNPDLLHCCTKESFEETYGKLDPIVFEEYNQG